MSNGTTRLATQVAGTNYYECEASQLNSKLISIPAPGTGSNDHNPPRIAPRNLFDMSVGQDNLFKGTRYKWSAMLTAVNITNKYALYNFLSTFQRNALCDTACVDGRGGVPFLGEVAKLDTVTPASK